MGSLIIREKNSQDKAWVQTLLLESWGSERMLLQGHTYYPIDLPGFIAEMNGQRIGLLTYSIDGKSCEIISLNSLQPRLGIGTQLLDALKQAAKKNGCTELKLRTTNDNTDALRFYQKYGFHLHALYKDAVTQDRLLKPEIPLTAENGILIEDYLLLKMSL